MNADDLPIEESGPPPAANPLRPVAEVMSALGTVWIGALMLLIVADVLGRNFFNAPITGVAEFAANSVASIVFLTLAAAICSGRMTRSDFVMRLIGDRAPGVVTVLEVLNLLVGTALFALLATIGWPELTQSWTSKEFIGVQGVVTMPAWPFRALLVVGAVIAALAYLLCLPATLREAAARAAAAATKTPGARA